MPAIVVSDVTFSFSSQPLLSGVSLRVGDGERACLIGPNGCGKTTLVRLILGELIPDAGRATIEGISPASVLTDGVSSSISGPAGQAGAVWIPDALSMEGSVGEYLAEATAPITALMDRFQQVTLDLADADSEQESEKLAGEYDRLLSAIEVADAWNLPTRVEQTLTGLGLDCLIGEGSERPIQTLSPGQRGRLALATRLLIHPGALVLDEPTNHLDDEAVEYLTQMLRDFPGPVLMTSHDRAFIEEVATCLYDLDIASWQAVATARGGADLPGVARCAGNYSDYLVAKADARRAHERAHASQQDDKKQLAAHRRRSENIAAGGIHLKEADRNTKKFYSDRASATAVRRTRNDDRRLEVLGAHEVRKPRDYRLHLDLPVVKNAHGVAVSVREASVEGRLAPVTVDIHAGEHLLLTGPNGCGKSTLLTWIAQGRAPVDHANGRISVGPNLWWIPQHLPKLGDPGITEEIWHGGVADRGAGLLHPSLWGVALQKLSAGNQRRAQLALAVSQHPDILVIDEPTNYLDLDSLEVLESALGSWNGTLIVASHDRWLISHWHGRRLALTPYH